MEEPEIREWQEFALHLRRLARWDLERVDAALKEILPVLPELEELSRPILLKLGRVVAERSSKLAIQFLRIAPPALLRIAATDRQSFLKWAGVLADHSREGLIEFFERGPEILSPLGADRSAGLLDFGEKLAREDWAVSIKFFISIPKISREIHEEKIISWLEAGRALVAENPAAAMAYFSLESKQARRNGRESGPEVFLRDVAGLLKILVQALTGKPMGIRSLGEAEEKRPAGSGRWPFTDGEFVFLPESGKELPSAEANFKAFKMAAAHQAGQVEFGTFAFALAAVSDFFPRDLLEKSLLAVLDREKPVSPLEAFLNLFPKRNLARDLFSVLEGSRVDHCLRRHYRGLAEDMSLLWPEFFKMRPEIRSLPLQEALVEVLLRLGASAQIPGDLPPPICLELGEMASRVAALGKEGATVGDAARLTIRFYRWLARMPNLPPEAVEAGLDAEDCPPLPAVSAERPGMDFAARLSDREEPYRPLPPLSHRGELRPELVQKKMRIREIQNLLDKMEGGIPLSPEALQELLDRGMEIDLEMYEGDGEEFFPGLAATDLPDWAKKGALRGKSAERNGERLKSELSALQAEVETETGEKTFLYDEWDYLINDYRANWCRLREKSIPDGEAGFVPKTLEENADLVNEVRKQFQMLKPERFKKIPHLERGEEIDLNEAVEAAVDRRAGQAPSEKIYLERNRKDRDLSTLFLIDLSASTDERANGKDQTPPPEEAACGKRVIDIEKEALVVMAEALAELGDEYAIFGFSGYGRKEVDFFVVKDFREKYGAEVKERIGGLKAQRSTRMGAALRHAIAKMENREEKVKNIILVSDGYPQDYDYGEDRASKEYALRDTTMALEEAARKNIHTFCITVDRTGYDYLRRMCHASRYLVIEETCELPRQLPKIYRRLTT
jgi:hypothetical protein